MKRIQLHITERQDRILRRLSRRRGEARAALIREAIDRHLEALEGEGAEGDDPLLDLIGQAGSVGTDDLSEDHDRAVLGLDDR